MGINDQEVQGEQNLSIHCQSLLQEMLTTLQSVFKYYRSLPGSEGEWECSALGIIQDEIKDLISKKYVPNERELQQARQELENLNQT